MAYRIGDGYPSYFCAPEELREFVGEEGEDGFTCPLCNTSYEKDLQLAAELGKTLLERNKELEAALRQHQNIVDDQAQEIEYLRKQTAALREVNDSRMRIYEQLEVSIQELEHNNHRLNTQCTADKKHISTLENQVEQLETRCEELTKRLEDTQRENQSKEIPTAETRRPAEPYRENEVVNQLREELAEAKTVNCKYQATIRGLQATVDTVTQENQKLEEQLVVMQHRQEELAVMDQVRRGEVCRRCLRTQEELSLMGDEDDVSIIESLISDDQNHTFLREQLISLSSSDNPYRILVEKYEALLKVQQQQANRNNQNEENKCLSLQEELEMSGEFSSFRRVEDMDSESEISKPPKSQLTPTDFSETSSGFSDEAVNKSTQTDAHVPPGAFLCSISDGDECKFSIYDEVNDIEARFRKTPEYKKLFREIFDVLKRAAEAKDEGEKLPLLEDMTPVKENPPKVPPVTPAAEEAPSSLGQVDEEPCSSMTSSTDEPPKKGDILEDLAHGLGTKKKRGRRHPMVQPGSPAPGVLVSKLANGEKGRRKKRGASGSRSGADSGRSTPERRPRTARQPDPPKTDWFANFSPSSASQEVAKLKQLEKSYAEVLRIGRQRVNRK